MKKHLTLIVLAALMLASCASMAEYSATTSSQRFQDGVYSRPAVAVPAADGEIAALAQKTKDSRVYLKRGQIDTLYIPENKAASFRYSWADSTTTVTLYDEYDYFGYSPWGPSWYSPWRYGWYGWGSPYYSWYSPWRWGSPWYWSSWSFYDPWYYSSWYYDPWYYGSWGYSPWYWDSWYGPYWGIGYDYWAYGGWYSPWYHGMYPYRPYGYG